MKTPTSIAIESNRNQIATERRAVQDGVLAALDAAGWDLTDYEDGSAIATKVVKSIHMDNAKGYLTKGDGINRMLSFEFISEGRNVAAQALVLIPVGATMQQALGLAAEAAATAEKSIKASFAVRMAL